MDKLITPDRATSEYRRQAAPKAAPRPDRFALWAVALAVVAMFAGLMSADAGASGGGVGTGGSGDGDGQSTQSGSFYGQAWTNVSTRNKRWARRTSECESGGDPNAVNPAGPYLGAFQFLKSTWRSSPKSPGGNPINYNWRTQAVVAVALKKRDGAGHWPVCG